MVLVFMSWHLGWMGIRHSWCWSPMGVMFCRINHLPIKSGNMGDISLGIMGLMRINMEGTQCLMSLPHYHGW